MAWWIFQNLVITTVLAAAVALACRAGRIGPVARHALWVLVLVKFVTPPIVVWPWAAPDPLGIAALDARAVEAPVAVVPIADSALAKIPDAVSAANLLLPDLSSDRRERAGDVAGASVWPWLIGLWALGSLCLLCIEGVRFVRLARRVSSVSADDHLLVRVKVQSTRLGIRPVPVVMVDGITSPVVWGWGRPRLLWPTTLCVDATDACIDGILVHELAHIKRGDHLVGWIELAAGVIWWWNPLFWSVRSALREQAELACDAWVISALPNGRRAYAESLLALSGAAVLNPSSMAVVGIRPTSRRLLERRLVMIMKGRTSLRLPWAGLCCLAVVAAATLPAWASAPQQPPPPPPVPDVVISQAPPQPAPAVKPPAPPRVLVSQPRPPVLRNRMQEGPKPRPEVKVAPMPEFYFSHSFPKTSLPEEGRQLLEGLETDLKAIQEEADQKVVARRAAAVKALEALQDQYTKAGKLDEAVAIRDYLRAGGPGKGPFRYTYAIKR